ncbi:MAG: hypothetical protein P4L69_11230, partial [Desulfosporosinus sp.]|nr:hypothetical protein [Desulfosporosinus sp.]
MAEDVLGIIGRAKILTGRFSGMIGQRNSAFVVGLRRVEMPIRQVPHLGEGAGRRHRDGDILHRVERA